MSTQTEKKVREYEEFCSTEDYKEEILSVAEMCSNFAGAGEEITDSFSNILKLLSQALEKKYKYRVDMSKKWLKKQGFFSKLRDTLIEKQEIRLLKQKMKKERLLDELKSLKKEIKEAKAELTETTQATETSLSQASQVSKETEVLDTIEPSDTEVLEEGESSSLLEF